MRDWTKDGEEWKGEKPDDRPKLSEGRLVLWFESQVRWILEGDCEDALMSQLVAERESMLVWKPWDSYQGEDYSTGRWTVSADAVLRAVRRLTGREPLLYHCRPSLTEARLIAWFQSSVRTLAKAALDLAQPAGIDAAEVLADLTANRGGFLSFHPNDEYAGSGFNAGGWRLNVEKVSAHIKALLDNRERELYYGRLPRPYHLRDNRGVLAADGSPVREVAEPDAWRLLESDAYKRLLTWQKKAKLLPRPCKECQKEYTPKDARYRARCPECCERRAEERKAKVRRRLDQRTRPAAPDPKVLPMHPRDKP